MKNHTLAAAALLTGALVTARSTVGQVPADPKGTTTTTSVRITPNGERPRFTAAPGWTVLMSPQGLRIGRRFGQTSDDGIISGESVVDADGGTLRISFVQAGQGPRLDAPGYRLVVLDAAGGRYLPSRGEAGGMSSHGTYLSHATFTLDPKVLAPGKAAYIAAERRTSGVE